MTVRGRKQKISIDTRPRNSPRETRQATVSVRAGTVFIQAPQGSRYAVRWMIEIFFRTLKSGCRIEERRLETLPRMLACTAIYLIVAWRTLYVCRLGRRCPDLDCDLIFDSAEWQSVWRVIHHGEPLPPKPPPLAEMVRLIARLGGYVDRPNRGDPPGVETVWKGMQRMRDLTWAWQTFGPGTKNE